MYSAPTPRPSLAGTPDPIRTRILISRLDPQRVLEMVEYTDGHFGIHENGVRVGAPWEMRQIEECVNAYCCLVSPEQPRLRAAARNGQRFGQCAEPE